MDECLQAYLVFRDNGLQVDVASPADGRDEADRYHPEDTLNTRREGSSGFGLGLSIVRRLCERYAIDLRIEHADEHATAGIAPAASGAAGATATPVR